MKKNAPQDVFKFTQKFSCCNEKFSKFLFAPVIILNSILIEDH